MLKQNEMSQMTRFRIVCKDGITGEHHFSPEFDDAKQDAFGHVLTPEYVMVWHEKMANHKRQYMSVIWSAAEL